MTVELEDFLAGYLAEVDEHLTAVARHLVEADAALRRGEAAPRAVRELYRSMHTVKGLSAMVGVEPIVELAHAMESLLRAADRGGGALGQEAIDALTEGLRAVEVRVRALGAREPVPAPPAELVARLGSLQPDEAAAPAVELSLPSDVAAKLSPAERAQLAAGVAAGRRAVRVDFLPSPSRAATGINITRVRERVSALAEIVKVYPLSLPRSDAAPSGLGFAIIALYDGADEPLLQAAAAERVVPLSGGAPRPAPAPRFDEELPARSSTRLVRVDVARLDDAMEKLSALVVNRFRLGRAVAALRERGADVRALQDILHENGRQLRDLRASIMRARMVRMAELLERIPLLVRGLERATGRQVRLELDAGRAELDKAVAERLFPAIVHLVRNAVDHAIEPAEARQRAGKPAAGHVRVACHERGNNQLELSVSDDGAGIDAEAVAKKAGRPTPETSDLLLDLLTRPGLTTRDEVSATSGRGLGMDIVRRIVDDLGGTLQLATAPGRGTTFTVRVPLTITIVDAFSFVAAGQPFVAPVATVDEIVELEPGKLRRGPPMRAARAEVVLYERRGEAVPLVALDRLFALPAARPAEKALVVRRNGRPFAFAVHRMLGQQEVVVRPLEDPLVKVVGVAGSTDLGDGRPTLVLDLLALSGAISTGAAA